MRTEAITRRDDLISRRLVLEPGDAMPWHADVCHRFTVVVRGERLPIEFRDNDEAVEIAVHPGMVDRDRPTARFQPGVNAGATTCEVVTFFLDTPEVDPQPQPA